MTSKWRDEFDSIQKQQRVSAIRKAIERPSSQARTHYFLCTTQLLPAPLALVKMSDANNCIITVCVCLVVVLLKKKKKSGLTLNCL